MNYVVQSTSTLYFIFTLSMDTLKNEQSEEPIEVNPSTIKKSPKNSGQGSFFREVIILIILVVGIVIPIKMLVAQPFIVSGTSMRPTFEDGQYLIIDRISYAFNEPQREDVIVFRYPDDPKKFFIKRVIGLPGETVNIEGGTVKITQVDGTEITLNQDYIVYPKKSDNTLTLENEEYFVMGDNRKDSYDSRSWGPLKSEFKF